MPPFGKSTPEFVEALRRQLEDPAETKAFETPFQPPTEPLNPLAPGTYESPADKILSSVKGKKKKAPYVFHYRVFTVHQARCSTCYARIKKQLDEGEDPEVIADTPCTHNDKEEYEALVNRGLQGNIVLASFREETLRDGSVQICVGWGELVKEEVGPLAAKVKEPVRF